MNSDGTFSEKLHRPA